MHLTPSLLPNPLGNAQDVLQGRVFAPRGQRALSAAALVDGATSATADPTDASLRIASRVFNRHPGRELTALALLDFAAASSPTATSAENVLSSYSIAAASGTWVNSGVSTLSLPSAGTFLLWANLRYDFAETGGAFLSARLYNTTDAAAVTNSERLLKYNAADATESGEAGCQWLVTVGAAKTIDLSVRRTGTFAQSDITSNSDGRSSFGYVKLS